MSSRKEPPPSARRLEEPGAWDVESIFNPPKHDFGKGSTDNEPRRSPPRFLGKKRRGVIEFKGGSGTSECYSALKSGDADAAATAAPSAAASAAAASASALDDQDVFPIKFSLSHDYKDDASFSEYLKENLMGSSPRGSPPLGSFGMFAPSPLHVQVADAFDFESNGSGFPLPKLQMSPLSTPPRRLGAAKLGGSPAALADARNDLVDAKIGLESPPSIKKPLGKQVNEKLPPSRFPMELIPSRNENDLIKALSPRLEGSTYRPIVNHHGPTQHQSPGQTIYNVPSKSVGSPPSPYQPYPWRPAPHLTHSTPIRAPRNCHERIGIGTSPEFNPPRSQLRGQSRSNATTITVTTLYPNSVASHVDNAKQGKLDPITPSPAHQSQIRQSVSDESTSPTLAPTVHQPAAPTAPMTSGRWPDSLHMAPLPPYVAHQMSGGHPPQPWGSHHHHPPAMPSARSGYHHATAYYSPYYHQHHHQTAVPDRTTSNANADPGTNPASMSEAARWRKHHHLLHQFLLQFGHCNVPEGYGVGTHYETLWQWCNEQRAQYQRMHRKSNSDGGEAQSDVEACTMTPTRVRVLTAMGFVWGHPTDGLRPPPAVVASGNAAATATKPYSTWNRWMELLSDYRARHGNVDVPLKYEDNPSLGTFVNRQRTEFRKMQNGKPSSMSPDRVADLDRLGFTWAVRDSHTSWEDRFAELKEFRDINGHTNVPKIYAKNPSLGYWVNEQRFQYRRLLRKKPSYMTQEKIDTLNGLEFKWSLRETNGSWENWLKELREYKEQHGDVDVPLKYRHNQALGAFVNRQRTEHRKLQQGLQTSLTQERIQNLNDLGFKWAIRVSRTPWETRLEELRQFKEQHGHCNVPSTYPKNQPLAYWVFKQRGQYRIYKKQDYAIPGEKRQMCHMTPERIAMLDAVGFEWNPPRRIK